jgi:hypothetical protein
VAACEERAEALRCCSESDRRRWGSVADTESLNDATADLAVPQWYAVCIGGACAVGGSLQPPAVHGWCCALRAGAVVGGALAGGGLRGASRGAAVRAENQIGDDGAASLAPSLFRMTQLTSLQLNGTLRALSLRALSAVALWADACDCRLCMDGVVCCGLGWGGCWRGCSGWWLAMGLRCVQTIRSEQLGQCRWHRVSSGCHG